jgi:transcriptional regulator with XRE-family HTH domain
MGMTTIAQNLRSLRKARGMTLQQLAEKVGTSNQQISHHENSKRRINWDWIMRYSKALECHPSDLTEGPDAILRAQDDHEKKLLETFRGLSEPEKRKIVRMSKDLLKS